MFRPLLRRPSPAFVVSCIALVAALGGVAVAAPVGGDGRVHLCYDQATVDTQDGNFLVAVNAGDACPTDFPQRLVINQTGPKGAPGPQGPTGPSGAKGPTGPTGSTGVKPLDPVLGQKLEQQLKAVDKKVDKREAELDKFKKKLLELKRDRGQVKGDELARKQRELADQMQALMEFLRILRDHQAQVMQQLGKP